MQEMIFSQVIVSLSPSCAHEDAFKYCINVRAFVRVKIHIWISPVWVRIVFYMTSYSTLQVLPSIATTSPL